MDAVHPRHYHVGMGNDREQVRHGGTHLLELIDEIAAHDEDMADHLSLPVNDVEMECVLDPVGQRKIRPACATRF